MTGNTKKSEKNLLRLCKLHAMKDIVITSRDNALMRELRDDRVLQKHRRVRLDGDHLIDAAVGRGRRLSVLVTVETQSVPPAWRDAAERVVTVTEALMKSIGTLPSPAPCVALLPLSDPPEIVPDAPSVVLDRVQDAGNVGSILRSAAAFGYTQIIALTGTARLWSPKVVRAGMGAHFALHLIDAASPDALDALRVPLLTTSSHRGDDLHRADVPFPCAWLFGHEGRGVRDELAARSTRRVRIAQPGGEESLNVAAAAAVCLHAGAVRRGGA